jgi:ABC-2 type transport system permease protein
MSADLNDTKSQTKVLRRLYLTLFLRGRTSRGLNLKSGPKSIVSRLSFTLLFYSLFGGIALLFLGQPLFNLSIYLHGVSLFFVGMFVATSAGEVLFNEQEAEIMLHRPVSPQAILKAKASVLIEVSLWLILAFNLVGMLMGTFAKSGSTFFGLAHLISSSLSALFCTGSVIFVYQICLRYLGRQRLDGLMTLAQIIMTLLIFVGSQLVTRLNQYIPAKIELTTETWWLTLLPPVWFSALDQVLIGHGNSTLWILAAMGVATTALVILLALGRLAKSYESGQQTLVESVTRNPTQSGKLRLLQRLVILPPFRWLLRNPVERAGFLLVSGYMFRDRDAKLRLFPGLVPMMMMPVMMVVTTKLERNSGANGFMLMLAGSYLPLIPMIALNLLKFSQHWQAADVFLITPTLGPGQLMIGARKAVEIFLVIPAVIIVGVAFLWVSGGISGLFAMLPGVAALPIFLRVSIMHSENLPLSQPGEEAKSAGRGLIMLGAMFGALAIGGAAAAAKYFGYFTSFIIIEGIIALTIAHMMDAKIRNLRWNLLDSTTS